MWEATKGHLVHVMNQRNSPPSSLEDEFGSNISRIDYTSRNKQWEAKQREFVLNSSTYSSVTPELCHFSNPHGGQQHLPHLHLEHLPHENFSGMLVFATVVNDCSFKVVQQSLEVEHQLCGLNKRGQRE